MLLIRGLGGGVLGIQGTPAVPVDFYCYLQERNNDSSLCPSCKGVGNTNAMSPSVVFRYNCLQPPALILLLQDRAFLH